MVTSMSIAERGYTNGERTAVTGNYKTDNHKIKKKIII